MPAMMMNMLF